MPYSVSYTHFLHRGDVIYCIFGSKPKASSMARMRNGRAKQPHKKVGARIVHAPTIVSIT